jgi:hypothetical protein
MKPSPMKTTNDDARYLLNLAQCYWLAPEGSVEVEKLRELLSHACGRLGVTEREMLKRGLDGLAPVTPEEATKTMEASP